MQKSKTAPFLTFNGNAEEAMRFYTSVFPGAEVTKLVHYEDDENRVLHGALACAGQEIMLTPPSHRLPCTLACLGCVPTSSNLCT